MRKWQTIVTFRGHLLRGKQLVEEMIAVIIDTDLPFSHNAIPTYQDLVWAEVFRLRPEWRNADRAGNVAFLPKDGLWLTSPLLALTHRYQEV